MRPPSNYVARLGIGSLAIPCLTERQREFVLEAKSKFTLATVARFLQGKRWAAGEEIFNTEVRRGQLRLAYQAFMRDVRAWRPKQRWADEVAWMVPHDFARTVVVERDRDILVRLVNEVIEISSARLSRRTPPDKADRRVRALRRLHLAEYQDLEDWLPYLSIEGIRLISRLRAGDVSQILVAFALGADSLGQPARLRPWSKRVPARMRSIPITWLYQFSPSRRLEDLLMRCSAIGYRNLGYLAVLHPEAVSRISEENVESWLTFRTALEQLYAIDEFRATFLLAGGSS